MTKRQRISWFRETLIEWAIFMLVALPLILSLDSDKPAAGSVVLISAVLFLLLGASNAAHRMKGR